MTESTVKKRRGRPPKAKDKSTSVGSETIESFNEVVNDDFVKETTIKSSGAILIKTPKTKTEKKYQVWMGTTEECPYWTVHAGGADFPRHNEILHWDEDGGVSHRDRVLGKTIELGRTDIELIAKAVGRKVVRSEGARSFVLNADSGRYRQKGNDEPLGKFLYMKVIEADMPHNWRHKTPETMV